jgi:hypothetical protein
MRTGVSGAVIVVALLVAGCGDDDDSTGSSSRRSESSKSAYVEAIAAQTGDDFTPTESRCIAEAYVDGIGLDALRSEVSAKELRDNPDAGLSTYVTPDQAQGEDIYAGMHECADLRGLAVSQFAAQYQLPADFDTQCLEDQIDDALLEDLMVTYLSESANAEAATVAQWLGRCTDLRQALVTLVSEGATSPLAPETIACVTAQLDDDFVQRFWTASLADPDAFVSSPEAAELETKLAPCVPGS